MTPLEAFENIICDVKPDVSLRSARLPNNLNPNPATTFARQTCHCTNNLSVLKHVQSHHIILFNIFCFASPGYKYRSNDNTCSLPNLSILLIKYLDIGDKPLNPTPDFS